MLYAIHLAYSCNPYSPIGHRLLISYSTLVFKMPTVANGTPVRWPGSSDIQVSDEDTLNLTTSTQSHETKVELN